MQFRRLTPAEEKNRDQIIFGSYNPDKYMGGYRAYSSLSAEQARQLLSKGYASPDDAQNESPTFHELLQFIAKHTGFSLSGYVIDASRNDCRITADCIYGNTDDKQAQLDFAEAFHDADEFTIDNGFCRAWWD